MSRRRPQPKPAKRAKRTYFPAALLSILAVLFLFTIVRVAYAYHLQSQQPLHERILYPSPEGTSWISISPGPVIGIQLGATYAAVGIVANGSVNLIPNERGNRVTPNVVGFTEVTPTDSGILLGEDAQDLLLSNAKQMGVVFDMHRLIGRKWGDPAVQEARKDLPFHIRNVGGEVKIRIGAGNETRRYSPEDITAIMLSKMKGLAEEYLGEKVEQAVVSVPADFGDDQRAAMKRAGGLAGLQILRLISEPTAAGLAYGIDAPGQQLGYLSPYGGYDDERHILIYNLGNRSFSASVMTFEDGVFELLSTFHDVHLGLESFSSASFINTTKVIDRVLHEAHLNKSSIDDIVMIGGSEVVYTLLEKHFGDTPHKGIDSNEVIAHGVAIQAGILASESGPTNGCSGLLMDVTPLTLGIETTGGHFWPIIKRGTTVPTRKSYNFTTTEDNQTVAFIQIFEGEGPLTYRATPLGKLILDEIPVGKKQEQWIEVTFEHYIPDRLNVTARCEGNSKSLEIFTGRLKMSGEHIERVVEDSEKFQLEKFEMQNEIGSALFGSAMVVVPDQDELE